MSIRTFICAVVFNGLLASWCAAAEARATIQQRSCMGWHRTLDRMLDWSEELRIHSAELRSAIRAEGNKLRERCLRDISPASVGRYVILTKLLFDDEADEVESFE